MRSKERQEIGKPLDEIHDIAIDPASITAIDFDPPRRVLFVNRSVDELPDRAQGFEKRH